MIQTILIKQKYKVAVVKIQKKNVNNFKINKII